MNINNQYDVIIIGAGPSGIFCSYELIRQRPNLKILMIEKGRPIEKRVCPKRYHHRFCRGRRIFRRKALPFPGCRRKSS